MLEKNFDFKEAEKRIYEAWEAGGAFKPSGEGEPFTIVIPPPNVTGSLHMGHALNNTLQDVLSRFERMRGRSVLWQPGTDHAGIATQMVVERQMMERQEKRADMSREDFVKKVWEWRHESGGEIINQLKRLGASCDWSRERFTMGDNGEPDDQMVKAVMKTFVDMYNDGLIYRDKRLVNWDPKFETAISDLEVENTEVDGHFWHFKYPLEGGETYEYVEKDEDGNVTLRETRDYISIATTRPETMLGDGAVAVHPSDERYAPIVGKRCLLPLADRYIPIIADDYPDPDFGSGAVKITGAHDFNDYMVAKRNDIEMYVLFDTKAQMVDDEYVPEKYRGMDRFEARKAVVADLDAEGRLIAVEDKKIMQPFGDRSGVVIEPMLTDQWYVDAQKLAVPAIEAVEKGDTKFVPENWSKTYFQWMRNIEPWCISRQLWWGHRIPAWYGPDNAFVVVAATEEEAEKNARKKILELGIMNDETLNDFIQQNSGLIAGGLVQQDPDVLDTWFSSGLWPFSTLGWPDSGGASLLDKHYPNSVLVTAFDIIFFWVARMMMMGLYSQKEVPFPEVYIHGLVVDEHGQKMSKSKGNGIDPLVLIDQFGADALRFTLCAQAAHGRNVRLSESRVEGYRNFSTKLWNAARFAQMNECKPDASFDPASCKLTLNKWIVHEANECAASVTRELEAYRFNDAASATYRFIWNIFCDWHLELAKPVFMGDDEAAKVETRAATAYALGQILKLLHPFMPFVSEELWNELGYDGALITAAWPQAEAKLENAKAAQEMQWAIDLITGIRSVRQEMNVPVAAKIPLLFIGGGDGVSDLLKTHDDVLKRLARLSDIGTTDAAPKGAVQIVHGDGVAVLPVADFIDLDAEKARLKKESDKVQKEIDGIDKKLANKNFVDRAPAKVVEEQKTRRESHTSELEKLHAALKRLEDL